MVSLGESVSSTPFCAPSHQSCSHSDTTCERILRATGSQSPTWSTSPSAAARQLLLPLLTRARGASSVRCPILGHAHLRLTDGRGLRRRLPLSLTQVAGRSDVLHGEGAAPLPSSAARPSVEAAPRGSVDHAAAAGVFFLAGRGREIGALRDGFHYLL